MIGYGGKSSPLKNVVPVMVKSVFLEGVKVNILKSHDGYKSLFMESMMS